MQSSYMCPWTSTPPAGAPSLQVRVPGDAGTPESMCSRTQNNEPRRGGGNDIGSSSTCPWSSRSPGGSARHQVLVPNDALLQSQRVHDAGIRRRERIVTWDLRTYVHDPQDFPGVQPATGFGFLLLGKGSR